MTTLTETQIRAYHSIGWVDYTTPAWLTTEMFEYLTTMFGKGKYMIKRKQTEPDLNFPGEIHYAEFLLHPDAVKNMREQADAFEEMQMMDDGCPHAD